MDIIFIDKKMKRFYESHSTALKNLGDRNAKIFVQRIQEIEAANTIAILETLPGRLHSSHGTNKGQYALDMLHPKRLIIQPLLDKDQVSPNQATKVMILGITDYH